MEIKVLARRGTAVREIARQTGLSRNTVRRYLRNEQASRYSQREPRATKLDPFKDYLLERVSAARPHWPHKRREAEPVVRFETAPGKQMQADFTVIPSRTRAVARAGRDKGYSRASFVRFTAPEDATTLCDRLREAFVHFCVFRTKMTGRFGIVTGDFGNVTGRFGNVTERTGRQDWRCA